MIRDSTKITSTIEEYEQTPIGGKYQFVESEIIEMPSPTPEHQEISGNIFFLIQVFLKQNPIGKVFMAPLDVELNLENIFQPDVLFVSSSQIDIIRKKRIYGSPDLVVEVLSEGTGYLDYSKKKRIYAQNRVKEYWIVDIESKQIEVYKNSLEGEFTLAQIFKEDRELQSSVLFDFKPIINDIF